MASSTISKFSIITKEIYFGDKLLPDSLKSRKPKFFQEEVSFNINERTSVVNGLKRILEDELENRCLDLDIGDIGGIGKYETHDPYLNKNFVIERINSIPLSDKAPDSFTLSPGLLENNTPNTRIVYAEELGNSKYFNPNYRLFMLNPNKTIFIKKIRVTKGYGMDDANKYTQVCRTRFRVIDTLIKIPSTEAPSALKYQFTFNTNGNIDAMKHLHKACDTVIERVEDILEAAEDFTGDVPYMHEKLSITKVGETFHYQVSDEYHTLGQLFTTICLELDPAVQFASYKLIHFTMNTVILLVKHPSHFKLVKDSLAKIISIYKNIKTELVNPKLTNTLAESKKYYDLIIKSI